MWWLTGLFAACTVLSGYEMAAGNPTAFNGVVGAGIGTAVFALCAIIEPR